MKKKISLVLVSFFLFSCSMAPFNSKVIETYSIIEKFTLLKSWSYDYYNDHTPLGFLPLYEALDLTNTTVNEHSNFFSHIIINDRHNSYNNELYYKHDDNRTPYQQSSLQNATISFDYLYRKTSDLFCIPSSDIDYYTNATRAGVLTSIGLLSYDSEQELFLNFADFYHSYRFICPKINFANFSVIDNEFQLSLYNYEQSEPIINSMVGGGGFGAVLAEYLKDFSDGTHSTADAIAFFYNDYMVGQSIDTAFYQSLIDNLNINCADKLVVKVGGLNFIGSDFISSNTLITSKVNLLFCASVSIAYVDNTLTEQPDTNFSTMGYDFVFEAEIPLLAGDTPGWDAEHMEITNCFEFQIPTEESTADDFSIDNFNYYNLQNVHYSKSEGLSVFSYKDYATGKNITFKIVDSTPGNAEIPINHGMAILGKVTNSGKILTKLDDLIAIDILSKDLVVLREVQSSGANSYYFEELTDDIDASNLTPVKVGEFKYLESKKIENDWDLYFSYFTQNNDKLSFSIYSIRKNDLLEVK